MTQPNIVVICQEFEHHENVETRRIAYGLRAQGCDVSLAIAHSRQHGAGMLTNVVRQQPAVLHFHLRYPFATLLDLSLATLARKMGYRGRITCSGTQAVLDEQWIFDHVTAVDGVIPGKVDMALHGLIEALHNGSDFHCVPGIRTARRGSFEPLAQPAVIPWRAMRDDVSQMMGVPIAGVAATEGCGFRCSYCMHAAAARIVGSVHTTVVGSDLMCGQRRRPLADLVAEMSDLYHDQGVRYFYFSDENPLPSREADALKWILELQRLFEKAGMTDVSLGLNTRGDRLTPAIIERLLSIGVIRTLMGVESASPEGLRGLGRHGHASKGMRALKEMSACGTLVWFNSLFLHPESDVATVATELAFLKTIPNALFNTLKLRPFSGTDLTRRLAGMNRLVGNPILYEYGFQSDALNRFDRALTQFQLNATGAYDPALRLHDLLLNAKLAQRHGKTKRIRRIAAEVQPALWAQVSVVNRTRAELLDEILARCVDGADYDDLQKEAFRRFSAVGEQVTQQERRLRMTSVAPGHPYAQIAAAAVLLFAFAGSAGCNNAQDVDTPTDELADTDDDSETNSSITDSADTDSSADTATSRADSETAPEDTLAMSGDTELIDTETIELETADSDTGSSTECGREEKGAMSVEIEDIIYADTDCAGSSHFTETKVMVGTNGKVEKVSLCNYWSDRSEVEIAELERCFLELLADEEFVCLSGEQATACPLYIE